MARDEEDLRWSWRNPVPRHEDEPFDAEIRPEHVLAWGYDESWTFFERSEYGQELERDETELLTTFALAGALSVLANDATCPKGARAGEIIEELRTRLFDSPFAAGVSTLRWVSESADVPGTWRDHAQHLLALIGGGIFTVDRAIAYATAANKDFAANADAIKVEPLFNGIMLSARMRNIPSSIEYERASVGLFFEPKTGQFRWGPSGKLPREGLLATWSARRSREDLHASLARLNYPYSQMTRTRELRDAIIDTGYFVLDRAPTSDVAQVQQEMDTHGFTVVLRT